MWKASGRGRSLTPEKGMCKVIVAVKPGIGQRAPSNVSMIVIRGDRSAMNGGKGEEEREEDYTSETGEGQHGGGSSW